MIDHLTGTVYIRNAIKYDFCIEECIRSMAVVCKEVVCLECSSEDETLELLQSLKKDIPNLKLVSGAPWDIGEKSERLKILSDRCLNYVHTPWRLHVQADEVLHENGIEFLHNFDYGKYDCCSLKRVNLFGDHDHYFDKSMTNPPVGDNVLRLAKTTLKSCGDDQGLSQGKKYFDGYDHLSLFHYGFVRNSDILIEKSINMQEWFFNGKHDKKLDEAKKNGFNPYDFVAKENLKKLTVDHPEVAKKWVDERRKYYDQKNFS